MKLGLVRIQNEKLVGVQYFESKFQRELGEVVSINNVKWTVAVIGEDRDTIIDVLNGFIKKQNSIVRKVTSPQFMIQFSNGSTIRFFTSGMRSGRKI